MLLLNLLTLFVPVPELALAARLHFYFYLSGRFHNFAAFNIQ